jgi:hypothetical protein
MTTSYLFVSKQFMIILIFSKHTVLRSPMSKYMHSNENIECNQTVSLKKSILVCLYAQKLCIHLYMKKFANSQITQGQLLS